RDFEFAGMRSFVLEANHSGTLVLRRVSLCLLAVALQVALIVWSRITFFSVLMLAALWIAFLGVRTFYRAQDWEDPRTFFGHTVAAGGDSTRMLINLGGLELSEGNLEQANILLQR